MKIRIPNINGVEYYVENKNSIVLLGANGAGKTRMSVWIDENNPELSIHRISAQKSLRMPEYVSPTELEKAKDKFLYGTTNSDKDWLKTYGKKNNRWGNEPEIHMLNDYQPLMEFLMTENFEKSIEYREKHKEGNQQFDNETKLEKIKKIWEKVITHRKLQICAGKIEVKSIEGSSDKYNGNAMSDGERAIFHFIAEVVSAQPNSLIIIDEPENHLHNSILERLWNEIESERQDCVYLYITHNLDFARTRNNAQIVWIKNMLDKQTWDFELLNSDEFSDDLLLELLGNRQGVLFVEGTPDKSIDRKLYSRLYPQYSIMPLEGCASVIQATKSYNKLPMLHYKDIKGIVDRDRRTEEEINTLIADKIYVPLVAEIENLFLIPQVIEIVARKQSIENVENILEQTKAKTIEFLQLHIDEQALLFTKKKCQNAINNICNQSTDTIEKYKKSLDDMTDKVKPEEEYYKLIDELQKIVDEKDYIAALRVINNKGLLPFTNLTNAFGWKKQYYIDYVIRLLELKDDTADELCDIFRKFVTVD
jgi:ABC-type dipeptide/oligopeptide/nickel transport system ATPase component